ncbi:hypothetical protein IEO21_10188 [Rhodonia placenta]|uniref:FF domain-containing protein n=1 Tax=Rhodonia placenta TaxID=104341 RepID=A0A8H7NSX6_9APHY|nr:hypothetical protein IEO21_10188 [Postia placenta]
MRRAQVEKTRKERKAREAFRDVLQSLVKSGQMKARTKWKDVYPSFSDDIRYLDMLGNHGSNPLELFWDLVDNLDQQLDAKIAVAEGAIKRHSKKLEAQQEKQVPEGKEMNLFKVSPETSEEEFLAVIQGNEDEDVRKLSMQDLQEIYHTLHSQAMKQQADERRRAERRQCHLQDNLRYALRKLSELIDLRMSYEEADPLMQDLPEYKAIEDEEGRKAAFSKYIKRQRASRLRERAREASEDGGSTTSRKRKELPKDANPSASEIETATTASTRGMLRRMHIMTALLAHIADTTSMMLILRVAPHGMMRANETTHGTRRTTHAQPFHGRPETRVALCAAVVDRTPSCDLSCALERSEVCLLSTSRTTPSPRTKMRPLGYSHYGT